MPTIEWNPQYNVGMKKFDDDHQKLVQLLNKTYDLFMHNEPKNNVMMVINDLVDYSKYHFAEEERLMKETRYPGLEMQSYQHDIFSKRVIEFQDNYHNGVADLSLEIFTFLKAWLINHIVDSDKELGYFIASEGGLELTS
ncbi:MAG: hemerythrin family protein [Proteobacteria bacterium]|nr:hemerythrin family protein [Pseudomonadota bacterium]